MSSACFINAVRSPGGGLNTTHAATPGAYLIRALVERHIIADEDCDAVIFASVGKPHRAAARGRTSDVIVPSPAEFRWMNRGDSSPWFPGCRVFRQSADGAWPPAFERLSMLL